MNRKTGTFFVLISLTLIGMLLFGPPQKLALAGANPAGCYVAWPGSDSCSMPLSAVTSLSFTGTTSGTWIEYSNLTCGPLGAIANGTWTWSSTTCTGTWLDSNTGATGNIVTTIDACSYQFNDGNTPPSVVKTLL